MAVRGVAVVMVAGELWLGQRRWQLRKYWWLKEKTEVEFEERKSIDDISALVVKFMMELLKFTR